jgi:hypothetical protein
MLAWADFGGTAPFLSHDAGYSLMLSVVALPAVVAGAMSVVGVVGLYCEKAPGGIAAVVQVLAVILTLVLGAIGLIFLGPLAIAVLFLVPFMLLTALLFRRRSSQRWIEDLRPVDSPTRWALFVLTLTTFAGPFWGLTAWWLGLRQLAVLARGSEAHVTLGIALVALLLLGLTANVIVLVAAARKWRLPREIALAGSLLAALGLVLLDPMLWWEAALAVIPSVLLWFPASARDFRRLAPSTTSEIAPRHAD